MRFTLVSDILSELWFLERLPSPSFKKVNSARMSPPQPRRWAGGEIHQMPWPLIPGRIWTEQTRCGRHGILSSRNWFSRGQSSVWVTPPADGALLCPGGEGPAHGTEAWTLKVHATLRSIYSFHKSTPSHQCLERRRAGAILTLRSWYGTPKEQYHRIQAAVKRMSCLFVDENDFIFLKFIQEAFNL